MGRRTFTNEEKQDLVTFINRQIEDGSSINAACKAAGIAAQQFKNWSKKTKKKNTDSYISSADLDSEFTNIQNTTLTTKDELITVQIEAYALGMINALEMMKGLNEANS